MFHRVLVLRQCFRYILRRNALTSISATQSTHFSIELSAPDDLSKLNPENRSITGISSLFLL